MTTRTHDRREDPIPSHQPIGVRQPHGADIVRQNVRIGQLILVFSPNQLLYPDGAPVVLRQQSLSVLSYLAQQSPRPVTKNELLAEVWKNRCVTEDSIYQCVREIRKVLGAEYKQYLRTISKVGYQLAVDRLQELPKSCIDLRPDAGVDGCSGRLAIPSLDSFTQKVSYTLSKDGARIAFASSGHGSPILRAPTWMTHLEFDWQCEPIGSKVRSLSHRTRLVRFDARGTGLSERVHPGHIDQWVEDLDAVLTASKLNKPALIGCSGGALSAIRFAARNPDRVSCLILFGGFARGSLHRGASREHVEAFSLLIREGWGQKNTAFRQMMTSSLFPGATRQQMDEFNHLQQCSSDPPTAASLITHIAETNVQDDLVKISVPTLVIHSENDLRVPITEAHLMAEQIPNAQMVTFVSENHVPLAQEPAFDMVQQAIFNFVEENVST